MDSSGDRSQACGAQQQQQQLATVSPACSSGMCDIAGIKFEPKASADLLLANLPKLGGGEHAAMPATPKCAVVFDTMCESLNSLAAYGCDSESDDNEAAEVETDTKPKHVLYHSDSDEIPAADDGEESDSEENMPAEEEESDSDDDDDNMQHSPVIEDMKPLENRRKVHLEQCDIDQFGDMTLDDLPPISLPNAGVKPEDCDYMGKVASIIGRLVMVESLPNKPAFDIDTLLFVNHGLSPLGYIFDVIGPVASPMYAIRFNSAEDISAQNISVGMPVYAAPKSEHSHYVFVQHLLKERGSDASWTNDYEVPPEYQDYSDDEAECYLGVKSTTRKRSAFERHRDFEKDMNMRNLVDTRLHRMRDRSGPRKKRLMKTSEQPQKQQQPPQPQPQPQQQQLQYFHQPTQACAPMPVVPLPPLPTTCAYPSSYMLPQYFRPPMMQYAMTPPQPPMPHVLIQQRSLCPLPPLIPIRMANAPPDKSAAPPPPAVYPPDLGLPSVAPAPQPVPSMPFYNPQAYLWNTYSNQANAPPPPPPPPVTSAGEARPPRK